MFQKSGFNVRNRTVQFLDSHLWTMPSGSVGDLIGRRGQRRGLYFLSEQLPETFPKLGLSASHPLKTHHKKREDQTNKQMVTKLQKVSASEKTNLISVNIDWCISDEISQN